MTTVLLLALSYGIAGFTFSQILCGYKGLLEFWPNFVNRFTSNYKIHKVLYMCSACIAGQMALWTFPVFWWYAYDPGYHFVVVFVSIFVGFIIEKKLEDGEQ
jgi:hypothetical protein